MNLSSFGLAIILIAWLWQLFAVIKNRKNLEIGFLLLYVLGVIVLVWTPLISGIIGLNDWLNIADILIAAIILIKLKSK